MSYRKELLIEKLNRVVVFILGWVFRLVFLVIVVVIEVLVVLDWYIYEIRSNGERELIIVIKGYFLFYYREELFNWFVFIL